MKYDFDASWSSTYGRAARLIRDHAESGVVVDLGCGVGTLAGPLEELGIEHVGFEYDRASVEECHRRGVECHEIDLTDPTAARERVVAAVGDRRVAAVVMLDVVEHLPDPDLVVSGLAGLVDAVAGTGTRPLVVLSIPNVAHVDLGAKLVFGRWDVTEVGLLDSTHITLFTHERLFDTVATEGFVEVAADDVVIPVTEQGFPVGHPAVTSGAPVHDFLRSTRRHADPFGDTYQFVRAYRRAPDGPAPASAPPHAAQVTPSCTMVVVTSGADTLERTLLALEAQTLDDLDVVVVTSRSASAAVRSRIDGRGPGSPVRVEIVESDRRVDLLNAGLAAVAGGLVVLLGEGDEPPEGLAERFVASAVEHPGRLLRARWAGGDGREPVAPFGILGHLHHDETPLGSVAIPTVAARALGLRFADVGDGFEGWDFVARAASMVGVVECPVDAGMLVSDPAAGGTVPEEVASSLDVDPLLLPAGSARDVRRSVRAVFERDVLLARLATAEARLAAVERSRWWRLTSPLRAAAAFGRGSARRVADGDGG